MPIKDYGVLTAKVVERRREGSGDTPHYQLHVVDEGGSHFRIAVNVLSQEAPSELLFVVDEAFSHPLAAQVEALGDGWHPLPSAPGGPALDYVRGNLFDPVAMRPLPPDVSGPDNDLADLLDHYISRAIGDATARLAIFGQRWGPEAQTKDKVFGFLPGNGVHDVHMNQGNVGRFRDDDGVYQDGGLLLHLPGESRWVAIFLAFQSQAWHTDDQTGHALSEVPPPASDAVPPGSLPAGATVTVPLADGVQLGNQGGTISLLDAQGIKVTGVAYTKEQARQEGWTVTF